MKKIVVLVVVVVAAWLGVNYLRTGTFALFPPQMSAQDQAIHDLEKQIAAINSQISQAGRAAGMTGMDTTGDVSALMTRKEKLEKELAEAKKRLH
jgi:uncharacterized protein involved in exopolysaccharide biosynthesis